MPRANRIIMPGCLYHLTHRCHDRRFLFRFGLGRTKYRNRLRQAASDFSVRLLAYCITSDHTHLLVEAGELKRRAMWTESVAVGDRDYVEGVASALRKRRRRSKRVSRGTTRYLPDEPPPTSHARWIIQSDPRRSSAR